MFKLLCVAKPLSIQVHPNAQQAEEGFQREQHMEPSLRSYKDPLAKPELLLAYSDMLVLSGFMDLNAIKDDLVGAGFVELASLNIK